MPRAPRHSRGVLVVAIVATVAVAMVVLALFVGGQEQHRHGSNGVVLGRRSFPRPDFHRLLRSGVDYFSTYDIFSIRPAPAQAASVTHRPAFYYLNESTPFHFMWLSSQPRVAFVPELFTDEECDTLIGMARICLRHSETVGHHVGYRTSRQHWVRMDHPVVRPLRDRLVELLGVGPMGNTDGDNNSAHEPQHQAGPVPPPPPAGSVSFEDLQILRYGKDDFYKPHYDYFSSIGTDRAVTVFVYLSDVEEGGETWFPGAMQGFALADNTSCTGGLGVRPRKRSAVVFYDMTPDAVLDPYSLHGGCPVKRGTKWAATFWLSVNTGERLVQFGERLLRVQYL